MNAQLDSTGQPKPQPAPPQDIYPLTPTQQGMLFHALQSPGQGVYVIQTRFDLVGECDESAFDGAWQAICARHDALRTAMAWDGLSTPLQVVGHTARLPVSWHADASARDIDAALAADRAQGFDLRQAPLLRVQVWRHGTAHRHIVLTHHHILLDGWSMPLLLADWQLAYTALSQGVAPHWLAPAPRFRAHLLWLKRQSGDAARTFWRTELCGLTAPTTPAWVRAETPGSSPAPHVLEACLQTPVLQAIEAAARSLRITLSTAVLGAWMLLLGRHSGARDVVTGLTRSGRPMDVPEATRTLGMYITTLPVRSRLRPGQHLGAWLQSLQASLVSQGPHEHLAPIEVRRCADALPATLPVHDSIVVFENYPMPGTAGATTSARLRIEHARVVEQTHYPLSLYALPDAGGLRLKLLADPTRVHLQHAQALVAQLTQLLTALPDRLTQALGTLPLLTPAQEQAVLVFGAAPALHQPAWSLPPQRIAQSLALRAGHPVLKDVQGEITGAGLSERVRRLATLLHAHGVKPGDHVGIGLARHRDLVAATLACWHLGAAYVPLDAGFPDARLRLIAADAQLRAVLVEPRTRSKFDGWCPALLDIASATTLTDAQISALPAAHGTHPDDTAYLLHTSGSTGRPKGVPVRHRSLGNLLQSMAERIEHDPNSPWLAVTTLSFDIAGLELFLPLSMGGPLLLADEAQARDPEQLMPMLAAHPRCVMQATPATWRLLVHAGWPGHPGLTVLCGGEALERPLAEALLPRCAALWNVYGPTETTIWSAALRIDQALLDRHPDATAMPVGQPLRLTTLRVLDQDGQPAPVGVPGELCIGGIGLSLGYHAQPRLSAERFVPDPVADAPASVLYRTGDRACWQGDGTLSFLGRLDHQVKVRGHRIELGEIESALLTQAEVGQAVAVVDGAGAQARLLAFVEWRTGGQANTAQDAALKARLMAHLSGSLPAYMVPAAIHAITSWPLTPNGKIDRHALRPPEVAAVGLDMAAADVPQTPLVHTLLQLWRELLQRPDIGLDDHFFEAGGHSLLLVTLQGQIKKRMGHELALTDLFQHPTVRRLASHLERLRQPTADTPTTATSHGGDTAPNTTTGPGRARLQARQARLRQGTAPATPTRT